MSRYDNYLRGKKEQQVMANPIVRMLPPAELTKEHWRKAPVNYTDPTPEYGYSTLAELYIHAKK